MKHLKVGFLESNANSGLEVLRSLKENGDFDITFVTSVPESYDKRWLQYADRVIQVSDSMDPSCVLRAIPGIAFDGFFSFLDTHVEPASRVAARLGLRGLSPEAAHLARNKDKMRERLKAVNLPQPEYIILNPDQPSDPQALAALLDRACILKPSDGTASMHIRRIQNRHDFERQRDSIDPRPAYGKGAIGSGRFLLEEFLEGSLVSVETLTLGPGDTRVFGITDRILGGDSDCVELGGSFPANPPFKDECENLARRALDAIGFDFGAAHIEMLITRSGPRLIEINPRLAGALVAQMISTTCNRNLLVDLVIFHCTGEIPDYGPPEGVATLRAFHSSKNARIASIGKSKLQEEPGVVRYDLFKAPGDQVHRLASNQDRFGFVLVHAPERAQSVELAERILADTRIELTPLSL